jgi:HSP20 family protein
MTAHASPEQASWSAAASDWAGSPLSTLHPAVLAAQPIRNEHYMKDGQYVVRFELAGIDPDTDLDVSTEGQLLTVHAERRSATAGDCHSEFRYGAFCSHVPLPAGIDDSQVTATYDRGILEVSVGFEHNHPARKVRVVTTGRSGPQG